MNDILNLRSIRPAIGELTGVLEDVSDHFRVINSEIRAFRNALRVDLLEVPSASLLAVEIPAFIEKS